jgi:hypothetical protein
MKHLHTGVNPNPAKHGDVCAGLIIKADIVISSGVPSVLSWWDDVERPP